MNFSVSDDSAVNARARTAAVTEAQQQAQQIAQASGAKLGRIRNIIEQTPSQEQPNLDAGAAFRPPNRCRSWPVNSPSTSPSRSPTTSRDRAPEPCPVRIGCCHQAPSRTPDPDVEIPHRHVDPAWRCPEGIACLRATDAYASRSRPGNPLLQLRRECLGRAPRCRRGAECATNDLRRYTSGTQASRKRPFPSRAAQP